MNKQILALVQERKQFGITQDQMAEAMGVSQARISDIENSDDVLLSTLDSYREALDKLKEKQLK